MGRGHFARITVCCCFPPPLYIFLLVLWKRAEIKDLPFPSFLYYLGLYLDYNMKASPATLLSPPFDKSLLLLRFLLFPRLFCLFFRRNCGTAVCHRGVERPTRPLFDADLEPNSVSFLPALPYTGGKVCQVKEEKGVRVTQE